MSDKPSELEQQILDALQREHGEHAFDGQFASDNWCRVLCGVKTAVAIVAAGFGSFTDALAAPPCAEAAKMSSSTLKLLAAPATRGGGAMIIELAAAAAKAGVGVAAALNDPCVGSNGDWGATAAAATAPLIPMPVFDCCSKLLRSCCCFLPPATTVSTLGAMAGSSPVVVTAAAD